MPSLLGEGRGSNTKRRFRLVCVKMSGSCRGTLGLVVTADGLRFQSAFYPQGAPPRRARAGWRRGLPVRADHNRRPLTQGEGTRFWIVSTRVLRPTESRALASSSRPTAVDVLGLSWSPVAPSSRLGLYAHARTGAFHNFVVLGLRLATLS